jgi:hypothetical protein
MRARESSLPSGSSKINRRGSYRSWNRKAEQSEFVQQVEIFGRKTGVAIVFRRPFCELGPQQIQCCV